MRPSVGRACVALTAALLVSGCGPSSDSASPTSPSPTTTPAASSAPLVLEAASFDALVLAATRPSLVEFQSPT